MSNKKVIYLDQNKWIDIAKVILKKDASDRYKEVTKKIIEKVESEEWIFPLSLIHYWETMSRLDDKSRIKLSKTMGEISKNYSILPYLNIEKVELFNTLKTAINLPIVDFKDEVISKDFLKHLV